MISHSKKKNRPNCNSIEFGKWKNSKRAKHVFFFFFQQCKLSWYPVTPLFMSFLSTLVGIYAFIQG